MQFIDEAKIFIQSGTGGKGCVSFRREANVPFGGPDGGNGGKGGHIYAECIPGLNTLIDFRYTQHFKVRKGEHGKGKMRSGQASEHIIIKLPLGTQIFAEDGETLIIDMTEIGQNVLLVRGGDGGLGNAHFKSSTNQAPRRSTEGWPGEEKWIWLKLKLLSDVGLVGLPNAGKSTFLASCTEAKPKIADYPFTTLKPQLGVAAVDQYEFVIADLPGLIEGAHEGVGLGDRFLKHIERCSVIFHLIDATQEDVAEAYRIIRHELVEHNPLLALKKEIVALTKIDALKEEERQKKMNALRACVDKNVPLCGISSIAKVNIDHVLRTLYNTVSDIRKNAEKVPQKKTYHPLSNE